MANKALGAPAFSRDFFAKSALEVAPLLLNAVLIRGRRAGRIVEVEAYAGKDDAASHAYRGKTARNATMFGPPGHLYVYFTYGMHYCANVVCSEEGTATAVLIRALAPMRGIAEMQRLRPAARNVHDLCSGPAKLCQALSIDRSFDGCDLLAPRSPISLVKGDLPPPAEPKVSTRIGLSERVGDAATLRWRYCVSNDPNVSK